MAVKARQNTTLDYNSVSLEEHSTTVTYSATGETIDVTHLASTGREFIQDVVEHGITISGNWSVAVDTALQPEVGLGTKRTLVLGLTGSAETVTYTWTSLAECSAYDFDSSVGAVRTFNATFTLSGAPSSRVVA